MLLNMKHACVPRRDLLILYGDGIEAYMALKGKAEQLPCKHVQFGYTESLESVLTESPESVSCCKAPTPIV